MLITVNGKPVELESKTTIAELLKAKGRYAALVAVEHNLNWLRREDWTTVELRDGDKVEIVRIIAGG